MLNGNFNKLVNQYYQCVIKQSNFSNTKLIFFIKQNYSQNGGPNGRNNTTKQSQNAELQLNDQLFKNNIDVMSANNIIEQARQIRKKNFCQFFNPPPEYILPPNRLGPYPFQIEQIALLKMQNISNILREFIPSYLYAWHEDSEVGKALKEIIKIPKRIEDLLMQHHKEDPSRTIKASKRPGTYRPDILILNQNNSYEDTYFINNTDKNSKHINTNKNQNQNDKQTEFEQARKLLEVPAINGNQIQLKICEINARFPLNGYLLSVGINESIRIQSCNQLSIESKARLTSIPHMHSFVADLRRRIQPLLEQAENQNIYNNILWLIRDREPLKYDFLLINSVLQNTQLKARFVTHKNLITKQRKMENNDNYETILIDQQSGLEIQTCLLELHQDELLNLSDTVFKGLLNLSDKGLCLNDIRTNFLLHDKRLLTIFSGYYGDAILNDILQYNQQLNSNQNKQNESFISFKSELIKKLKDCVVPSVPVNHALTLLHENDNQQNITVQMEQIQILQKVWGILGQNVIFKPSFSGKGNGILCSSDFKDTNQFLQTLHNHRKQFAIAQNQPSFSEYFESGILQPFLPSIQVDIPVPVQSPNDINYFSWSKKRLNIVATILCMDGVFYGPGIFRSSEQKLIALSRGGYCFGAALNLPEIVEDARFLINYDLLDTQQQQQEQIKNKKLELGSKMRLAFQKYGAFIATLDGSFLDEQQWNSNRLECLVNQILQGEICDHYTQQSSKLEQQQQQKDQNETENDLNTQQFERKIKGVWDIKPQQQQKIEIYENLKDNYDSSIATARSHGQAQFDLHTDASWLDPPPRSLAISVINSDRNGGGYFTLIPISEIVKQLTSEEYDLLKCMKFQYNIPPEFQNQAEQLNKQQQNFCVLPLFFGVDGVRYRKDIMKPLIEPEKQICTQQNSLHISMLNAFHKFQNILNDISESQEYLRLIPERYVIVFDNTRLLHSRSEIHDPRRHLQRVRFDIPLLGLDTIFQEQKQYSLNTLTPQISAGNYTFDDLQQISKNTLNCYNDQNTQSIYWSVSGQSGKTSNQQLLFSKVVGTIHDTNQIQRQLLYDSIYRTGIFSQRIKKNNDNDIEIKRHHVICLNLFSFGHLYRSGEIFQQLLDYCKATHLPLGPTTTEEEIREILNFQEKFRINCLAGISTKLLSVVQMAQQQQVNLENIDLIIFAGEQLTPNHRKLFKSVCSKDVQFLGIYGSAEVGVFAFQTQDTLEMSRKLQNHELHTNQKDKEIQQGLDDDCKICQETCVYQFVPDIAHVEIISENNQQQIIKTGSLYVTNKIRIPHLIRYDTQDKASNLDILNGLQQNNQQGILEKRRQSQLFFKILGRVSNSRSFAIGQGWLYFDDIIQQILKPFELQDNPIQIKIEDLNKSKSQQLEKLQEKEKTNNNIIDIQQGILLTLIILDINCTNQQKIDVTNKFIEYIQVLLDQEKSIITQVQFIQKMEDFVKSKTSQKIVMFVDLRN